MRALHLLLCGNNNNDDDDIIMAIMSYLYRLKWFSKFCDVG